ncbi:raffinose/stachyose/melibiose transport system substrate-binding protein [Paraoerskovia marina]|uniref:Raffinose/stachyose/melibiose transport system substrate-binding protein n=1 Tax=Paraoerskovia marina TaxID=545619 RepID=A0A1H1VSI5_9CELL|nr:ABC transporter substrate-binding protein [Paraoerskovia marina]SDS87857.1 raffinose/stachyose/melibiose transport system substrate-binding protein [Paraoerskovia marina]
MTNLNRRSKKQVIAAVTVAALSVGALAGCSNSGADDADASEDTSANKTVDWWTWNPDQAVVGDWVDLFNKEHPDITINYRYIAFDDYANALRLAITTPSGPDVFGLNYGPMADQFGSAAIDLAPLAEENIGADWQDQLLGEDQLRVDDKQVALPWMVTGGGTLWYNQTVFDEAGATYPTNLDEWKKTCEKIEAIDKTCFTQGAKSSDFNRDIYVAIMNQISPGIVWDAAAGEVPFDSPEFIEGFEAWKSLFDEGIIEDGAFGLAQYPDAYDEFNRGEAGMIALGTWNNSNMTKAARDGNVETYGDVANDQVFTSGAFPTVVDSPMATDILRVGPDIAWAISEESDAKEAAWTFIDWLTTSDAAQDKIGSTLQTPALVSAEIDRSDLVDPELQNPALDSQATAMADESGSGSFPNADIENALYQALASTATEGLSAEDAAKSVQAAIDAS